MRNRRFRSIGFLILFALCAISLAGCHDSIASTTTAARSSTKSSATSKNTENTTAAPTPQIQASFSIVDGLSEFVNGRAVVELKDKSNDYYYGLIDENGYLLWQESTKNFDFSFDRIFLLSDGYIVLAPYVESYSEIHFGVLILDRMGKTIFDSRLQPQGYDYIYLGYENDTFLLWERYASFSSSEQYDLCEMDTGGTITIKQPFGSIIFYSLFKGVYSPELYGNGLIAFYRSDDYVAYIYNMKTHQLITKNENDDTYLIGIFGTDSDENVLVRACKKRDMLYGYYSIPLDAFKDKASLLSKLSSSKELPLYNIYAVGGGLINYYEHTVYWDETILGIYKFTGKRIFTYPSNWNIKEGTAFSKSGYAFVYMTGADKNEYFAVVNSSGEIVINPTLTNNNGRNTTEYEEALVKYTDVEENKEPVETKYQDSPQGSWKGWHYYKQDGSQLLTAYEVSNLSELLEYNVSPVENSSQTNKDNVEKTYTSIKGFTITGTWKNTGSYTYGQAQSGAIIVFDGGHCNFFSPSDTYAFYTEGDHYRLDCTSPLGDTVSFTVRIIDENHIDIFNGQNIVELTKIVQ